MVVLSVAIAAAAMSPQLQWREPVYILAGFAGIFALGLLLLQPLLITQNPPGVSAFRSRRLHRWIGGTLVLAVIVHVAALWVTSPPDVIDALLLRSPTWFSILGVIAMWTVFASAFIAVLRRRLHFWRFAHRAFALLIAGSSIAHALLIEGTMEPKSKAILCVFVGIATLLIMSDPRSGVRRRRP
ncbi:MAG: ferric reductase-like transmembrane domain-containing protein [Aliishimia sp.]